MVKIVEELELESFVPATASADDWRRLTDFLNAVNSEELPDDPPSMPEQTRNRWLNLPSILQREIWIVHKPDKGIVAFAFVDFINMEENSHLGQVRIAVLPAYRRRGIGRGLLTAVANATEANGRRLLLMNTTSLVPAGERFMERIGGTVGLRAATNQLDLAKVDRGLIADWIARGRKPAEIYEMGFWPGRYPDEALAKVAEVKGAMNQAPTGDLDVADIEWTPETIRQMDDAMERRQIERWTYYVTVRLGGELAGYTEIFWAPDKPNIAQQGDTAVLEAHRNQGLGHWLKAMRLDAVLREKPEVNLVRTGNANSNAPMLKINHELGFREYKSEIIWQVDLPTVQAYLAGSRKRVREQS